ncbi:hypothetical protein A4X13_0g1299 [Tilletia indica]|uniref:Uncharacterized protein n=1 Tax=Tilletia indica TaxID=43049 RepID=A0A8T8TEY3_9BASI|nr:hypothetical protein A4X13_0g1299 [Tilletia indica]
MREREPTYASTSSSTNMSCASTSTAISGRSCPVKADETTGLLHATSRHDQLVDGEGNGSSTSSATSSLPHFSRRAIIISIGAFLHMMGLCANFTYVLISSRAFICAAYYETNPHDPGLGSHKSCRTPEVEVALANYIRNTCLLIGIINPIAILFWGRLLRKIGPKGLAIIANVSVIVFDPLPWLFLPLGPPVGSPNPFISANMCKHLLLLSATLGAATGMGTLHTLAFRTMLVDVAGPNQITIHLSLFALAAYASTALGPLTSALVVNLVDSYGHKQRHYHPLPILPEIGNWTESTELPYPLPSPPLLPPLDPAVTHQRASFSVSLVFSIAALIWLVFFIKDTSPPSSASTNSSSQSARSTASKDDDGNEASSAQEEDSMRKNTTSISASENTCWSLQNSVCELLRPFKVLHPSTLQSASSISSPTSTSVIHKPAADARQRGEANGDYEDPLAQAQTEREIDHAAHWPLARILIASALMAAAAMANAPLMEFLTYRYGLDGTRLSFLLSAQAAVSGLVVFLGVPALRGAIESRSRKPAHLANVDLTDFEPEEAEVVPTRAGPGLDDVHDEADLERGRKTTRTRESSFSRDVTASPRQQQQEHLRTAFWSWQARIELRASTTALIAILLPWSLILLGVAFPNPTLSPLMLVVGWIFGSPDGTMSSFLQSAGLAILKSAGVDPALVDDFMTCFNTVATLATLAASGFVTVYSHSVQSLPWLTFVFPTLLALLSLAILLPLLLHLGPRHSGGPRR